MKIRDRYVAELLLEEIFFSPHNSNVFVDYNDIRKIRTENTFRLLCTDDFCPEEVPLDSFSYCAVEIISSVQVPYPHVAEVVDNVYRQLGDLPRLYCLRLSDEDSGHQVKVNLYFFSPKSDEDHLMDQRIEKLLKCYRQSRFPYSAKPSQKKEAATVLQSFAELSEDPIDADLRLASYSNILSYLTVNDESAAYIKRIVEEAVDYLESDLSKGLEVTPETLNSFVFRAGNLWIHLFGYYPDSDLAPTARRWSRVLENFCR